MSELAMKATRGMFWSLGENLGLQATQLLFSILLARLLLPEQFGLVGMLTIFIAIAQSLLDSGFGSALIQKKTTDPLDACSVFYFNLGIGIILTILLWVIAPRIAQFYREPLLTPLTRLLSLSIMINAFGLVPSALLTKQMNFKELMKVNLTAVTISGIFGVGLAMMGFGVWSLAIQSVLYTIIRAIFLWYASHWRPKWVFSIGSLKSMFSFGSRMMLSGLLDTFFNNIYQPLIGRVYSAADLGYYTRAQSMQTMVVQPTGIALGRVIFPALAPFQDDKDHLQQAYKKIMTTAVFFHFPLTIGLITIAEPLITLLLTKRWLPSVPYFQLFCFVGILWPLHVLNLNVLQVIGRSDLFFRLEVIKKFLVILTLVITYRWGILALLYGQIAVSVIAYFLNSSFSGKLIGYSTGLQISDVAPFLFISIVTGISMILIGSIVSPIFPRLLIQFALGVGVYLGLSYVFCKPVLSELMILTKQLVHSV